MGRNSERIARKTSQLSSSARGRLGSFTQADRDRWKVEVNQIRVGSRSLYDLADALFFYNFPEQKGKISSINL